MRYYPSKAIGMVIVIVLGIAAGCVGTISEAESPGNQTWKPISFSKRSLVKEYQPLVPEFRFTQGVAFLGGLRFLESSRMVNVTLQKHPDEPVVWRWLASQSPVAIGFAFVKDNTNQACCIKSLIIMDAGHDSAKEVFLEDLVEASLQDEMERFVVPSYAVRFAQVSPDGRFAVFDIDMYMGPQFFHRYFVLDLQEEVATSFSAPQERITGEPCAWLAGPRTIACVVPGGVRYVELPARTGGASFRGVDWEDRSANWFVATVSPSGKQLAIIDIRRGKTSSGGSARFYRLRLVNVEENTVTTVLETPHQIMTSKYSGDGEYVAFVVMGPEEGGNRVWVADRAGRVVSKGNGDQYGPVAFRWSPSMPRLGYVLSGLASGERSTVELMSEPDWKPRMIHRDEEALLRGLLWSPDGTYLLATGPKVWRLFDRGGERLVQTVSSPSYLEIPSYDGSAAWTGARKERRVLR